MLGLLVNGTSMYINTPSRTRSCLNSKPNRRTRPDKAEQTNGGNIPPKGFELVTSGSDTMLIARNTKSLSY